MSSVTLLVMHRATDLEGGSSFGYKLLIVILLSNFAAMFLQSLSLKLGVVAERDLAQACRDAYPRARPYHVHACHCMRLPCRVLGLTLLVNAHLHSAAEAAAVYSTMIVCLRSGWCTFFGCWQRWRSVQRIWQRSLGLPQRSICYSTSRCGLACSLQPWMCFSSSPLA